MRNAMTSLQTPYVYIMSFSLPDTHTDLLAQKAVWGFSLDIQQSNTTPLTIFAFHILSLYPCVHIAYLTACLFTILPSNNYLKCNT